MNPTKASGWVTEGGAKGGYYFQDSPANNNANVLRDCVMRVSKCIIAMLFIQGVIPEPLTML